MSAEITKRKILDKPIRLDGIEWKSRSWKRPFPSGHSSRSCVSADSSFQQNHRSRYINLCGHLTPSTDPAFFSSKQFPSSERAQILEIHNQMTIWNML
jgi:hypothetical protein